MVDPIIGVGGYTDSKNQITLSLDPPRLETIKDAEIFATLVHELSHVKRAYGPWYGTTLFDYDDSQYSYMDFVVGNEELGVPPSAVYGIGLYIVDKYLARTGKKASELLLEDSTVLRET